MKAKLFLAYLRIRKLLPAIAIFCLAVTIYNQFLDYRYSWANTAPWIVEEIQEKRSLYSFSSWKTI